MKTLTRLVVLLVAFAFGSETHAQSRADFSDALDAANGATQTTDLAGTLPGYAGDAPELQAKEGLNTSDLTAEGFVASVNNPLTPIVASNQTYLGANRIDENADWVKNALGISNNPTAGAGGVVGGGTNACHLRTSETTETTLYTCESGNVIGEGDFSCSTTRAFRKKEPQSRICVSSAYTAHYGSVPGGYKYIHHCQRAILHHNLTDPDNGCAYLTGSGACLALYGSGPDWATICNRTISGRSKVSYIGLYEETCSDVATCSQQSSVCSSYFGAGFCERQERSYLCDAGGYDDLGTTDNGCAALLSNPTCKLTSTGCTQTAAAIPDVMAYFGFAPDYCLATAYAYRCETLSGTGSNCDPDPACSFKTRSCLDETASSDSACQNWEYVYECKRTVTTPADASVCDASWVMGSTSITGADDPDQDIASALSALNGAKDASGSYQSTMSIFKGDDLRCGKAVLGFANCCKDSGWGTDVGLAECDSNELKLIESQKKKACHYVGTYCSKKSLFGCLQKSMTYCCYGNSLARIIQEAGHQQLGIGWGDAKSPNCAGFTVEDFQKLDLTDVDFSDFYNEKLGQLAQTDTGSTVAAITSSIETMNSSGTARK